jgi:hypothetical protein
LVIGVSEECHRHYLIATVLVCAGMVTTRQIYTNLHIAVPAVAENLDTQPHKAIVTMTVTAIVRTVPRCRLALAVL